jgi:hypothetical protein
MNGVEFSETRRQNERINVALPKWGVTESEVNAA